MAEHLDEFWRDPMQDSLCGKNSEKNAGGLEKIQKTTT